MIAYGPHVEEPSPAVPADVHVVRVDLDLDAPSSDPLFDVLSDDERAAARRFVHRADAVRFAAAHAVLRRELAAALGAPAASLRFVRSDRGRPALAGEGRAPLDFNLSHGGDHALIVWSRRRRVGVDVEPRRPGWDWTPLSRLVLGDGDVRRIAETPEPEARAALFHDVWVAKEALLKADGRGITEGMGTFSVLSADPRRPCPEGVGPAAGDLRGFEACWLRGIAGHAACLAWSRTAA